MTHMPKELDLTAINFRYHQSGGIGSGLDFQTALLDRFQQGYYRGSKSGWPPKTSCTYLQGTGESSRHRSWSSCEVSFGIDSISEIIILFRISTVRSTGQIGTASPRKLKLLIWMERIARLFSPIRQWNYPIRWKLTPTQAKCVSRMLATERLVVMTCTREVSEQLSEDSHIHLDWQSPVKTFIGPIGPRKASIVIFTGCPYL